MINIKASMFRDDGHRDAVMSALTWFLLRPGEWDDANFLRLT